MLPKTNWDREVQQVSTNNQEVNIVEIVFRYIYIFFFEQVFLLIFRKNIYY